MWGFRVTTFGFIWLFAAQAHASAWNPAAGQGELISGYVLTQADKAIDSSGRTIDLDIYEKRIVQNYGNVGLTDKLAIVATFDWQDTQIIGPGLNINFSKPSAISAGLQYQVSRREGHAVALSVSYIDGIDLPNALLTLENRDPSVELRALWGESRSLWGKNIFAEAQLAGHIGLDGGYGSTHAQLTIGGDPTDRIMVLLKGRYRNFRSGPFAGLVIDRQVRWETEASFVYRFRAQDYFEIGYAGILTGRNTVCENGLKIGYWRKF